MKTRINLKVMVCVLLIASPALAGWELLVSGVHGNSVVRYDATTGA